MCIEKPLFIFISGALIYITVLELILAATHIMNNQSEQSSYTDDSATVPENAWIYTNAAAMYDDLNSVVSVDMSAYGDEVSEIGDEIPRKEQRFKNRKRCLSQASANDPLPANSAIIDLSEFMTETPAEFVDNHQRYTQNIVTNTTRFEHELQDNLDDQLRQLLATDESGINSNIAQSRPSHGENISDDVEEEEWYAPSPHYSPLNSHSYRGHSGGNGNMHDPADRSMNPHAGFNEQESGIHMEMYKNDSYPVFEKENRFNNREQMNAGNSHAMNADELRYCESEPMLVIQSPPKSKLNAKSSNAAVFSAAIEKLVEEAEKNPTKSSSKQNGGYSRGDPRSAQKPIHSVDLWVETNGMPEKIKPHNDSYQKEQALSGASLFSAELPIRFTPNRVSKSLVGKTDAENNKALLKRKLRSDAVTVFQECKPDPQTKMLNSEGFVLFLSEMGVVSKDFRGNYINAIRQEAFILAEALGREYDDQQKKSNGSSEEEGLKHPAVVQGVSLDGVVMLLEFVIGVEEFEDESLRVLISELKKYKLMNKSRKIFSHQPVRSIATPSTTVSATPKTNKHSAVLNRSSRAAGVDPASRDRYRAKRWEKVVKHVENKDALNTYQPAINPATVLRVGEKAEAKCIVLHQPNNGNNSVYSADGESQLEEIEQWIPVHVLRVNSDSTYDVRFDNNYNEEVNVPRDCIRPHMDLHPSSRHGAVDQHVPLHKRLQVKNFTESSLYRRSDMRTTEQKSIDEHCTFKPVVKCENPFVSERTLREINAEKEHLENSPVPVARQMSKSRRSSSRSKARARRDNEKANTAYNIRSKVGGMYTSGFGFVSGDAVPIGVPLFYFNPAKPPAFDSGTYETTEQHADPLAQEPVTTAVTTMVEKDVEEEIEVEEAIPEEPSDDEEDNVPVAPPLPESAYTKAPKKEAPKASNKIVIAKKEEAAPAPAAGISWVDIMAEMSEKLNKRGGSANVLKKAPEKPPPGKLGGGKKKKGKKKAEDFKDVIDELSYTLAKLRGEIVEEESSEEEEEAPAPKTSSEPAKVVIQTETGLKLARPLPDPESIPNPPELDTSLYDHIPDATPPPPPPPIPPPVKEEALAPVPTPPPAEESKPPPPAPPPPPPIVERPPPPPKGKPAVGPAKHIPLCPPVPTQWPPKDFWKAPPLTDAQKLKIEAKKRAKEAASSGAKTRMVKKVVTTKKMVPVVTSHTTMPQPTVIMRTVNVVHSLPTGYYMPHPDGSDMPASLVNELSIVPHGNVTDAMHEKIIKMLLEAQDVERDRIKMKLRNHVGDEKECDDVDEDGSVAASVADSMVSNRSLAEIEALEKKISVADLPLPAGFHGAVQKMKYAREVRSHSDHIEKATEWRTYEDAEKLAAMKMHSTVPVAPVSHVDRRNEEKEYVGATYRKSSVKSDVHSLPLSHHIPEMPEANHPATVVADLPGAHWATNLRKYDGSNEMNCTIVGNSAATPNRKSTREPPPCRYLSSTQSSRMSQSELFSPMRTNNSPSHSKTKGGVVRCYPPTPREQPKAPNFEHLNRIDRQKTLKMEREAREKAAKDEELKRIQKYRENLKKKALAKAKEMGVQVGTTVERRKTSLGKLMNEYAYRPELALSVEALKNASLAEKEFYSSHPYASLTTKEEERRKKIKLEEKRKKEAAALKERNDTIAKIQDIHTSDPLLDNYAMDSYCTDDDLVAHNRISNPNPLASSNSSKLMTVSDLSYEYNKVQKIMASQAQSKSKPMRRGSATVQLGNGALAIVTNNDDEGVEPARVYIPINQRKLLSNRRASFK